MCVRRHVAIYCSAHDKWPIMKRCTYVGYHDANNVSHFGGDPVTQLYGQFKLVLLYAVLLARCTIAVMRPLVLWLLLRDHAHAAGVWKTDAGHTSLSTSLVNVNQHPHFYPLIMYYCFQTCVNSTSFDA